MDDQTSSKSHIAIATYAIVITNDELIHWWVAEHIDATFLGRWLETTSSNRPGKMHDNISAVSNSMTGNIAAEVGKGLGKALQSVARGGPTQANNVGASDGAKPYTQDHIATLLLVGFHWESNVRYLKSICRLFKSTKVPNYVYLCRAIKAEMIQWTDRNRCWILWQ